MHAAHVACRSPLALTTLLWLNADAGRGMLPTALVCCCLRSPSAAAHSHQPCAAAAACCLLEGPASRGSADRHTRAHTHARALAAHTHNGERTMGGCLSGLAHPDADLEQLYTLDKCVGEGVEGRVFLAACRATRQQVAIKLVERWALGVLWACGVRCAVCGVRPVCAAAGTRRPPAQPHGLYCVLVCRKPAWGLAHGARVRLDTQHHETRSTCTRCACTCTCTCTHMPMHTRAHANQGPGARPGS
jgi:hypothetical protein